MIRLLGTEVRRLASRRLFRWVLISFAGALVLVGTLIFVNNSDAGFTRGDMPEALMGLSFPLLMFGWLVGASSIGAEWGNRTVSSLLTWEPRRSRVLVAKVLAACAMAGAWVVLLQVVFTAVMLGAASGAGQRLVPVEPLSWSEYAVIAWRITLVAVAASGIGFALATIGKNTAAALGGGMAYLLVAETLVRNFRPRWSDWLLSTNIIRVIEGGEGLPLQGRTAAEATLVLGVYSATLLLVALWVFRRREMA